MFYKFQNIFFVLSHYLLKSFKFNIQQNQFIDLTIGSPNIFVNLYDFIPKLVIKALLPRNYDGMEYLSVTIIDSSIRGHSNHLVFYSFAVFSSVVMGGFRKVIDNKLKKSKIITTNKQNREMK